MSQVPMAGTGQSSAARAAKSYLDAAKIIRIGLMTQNLRLRIALYKFKLYLAEKSGEIRSSCGSMLWRREAAKKRGTPTREVMAPLADEFFYPPASRLLGNRRWKRSI